MRYAIALSLVVSLGATALHAQDSTQMDDQLCKKAVKIVEKGRPEKKEGWAWNLISRCGPAGAQAMATGMHALRLERDVNVLEEFMWLADNWRDADLMRAAVALASDGTASAETRVFAIRHLIGLLNGSHRYSFDGLTASSDSTVTPEMVTYTVGCRWASGSAHWNVTATPLSATYNAEILAVLSALAKDAQQPKIVRNAARCR